MLCVYKYPVPLQDVFTVALPKGARVLSFHEQNGDPFFWALVDPTAEAEERFFRFAGTGHPIGEPDESLYFIGTTLFRGGLLVFHLFEIGKKGGA